MKKPEPECDYHIDLHIDCDRFDYLWYAIEDFKENCEQSELDVLNAMQKELWAGIREKDIADSSRDENVYSVNASALPQDTNNVTIAPDAKIEVKYIGTDNSSCKELK